MAFYPWHLAASYGLDLVLGDPQSRFHPIRWIGHLITRAEAALYREEASPGRQRLAGFLFWICVVASVFAATSLALWVSSHIFPGVVGDAFAIWLAYTTLATRSLHHESARVAAALQGGDLALARERLAGIVSRDTSRLEEKDIVRALIETVSENISDGIVAPLLFLALGGPAAAMTYKAVNTMDSMVGYLNDRHRHFGWFAARADDLANWIPARLSGLLIALAAAPCGLDRSGAFRIMRRDARKMKSPNAGFPEAAAAGALAIQLGGVNIYFGVPVQKPTLGDPGRPLTLDAYNAMIRLMYVTSLLAFALGLCLCYVP